MSRQNVIGPINRTVLITSFAPLSNLFSLRGRRGSPSGRQQVSTPKRVPARHRHGEGTTRAHKNHRDASRARQGEPATGGACRGRSVRRMPLKISNGPRKQHRATRLRSNIASLRAKVPSLMSFKQLRRPQLQWLHTLTHTPPAQKYARQRPPRIYATRAYAPYFEQSSATRDVRLPDRKQP